MKNYTKNNIGFTLAEILVTLGVIGVIASMTVPTLVQDIQDAQYKSAWKKAYADLNSTMKRAVLYNSGSIKGICSSNECIRDLFLQYLNYTKKCDYNQSYGTCWYNGSVIAKYLNGSLIGTSSYPGINSAGAILSNGSLLMFENSSQTCQNADPGPTAGFTICGKLIVDINGWKGPNTMGKDIFRTWVLENVIKPGGIKGDCFDACDTTGTGCAAHYLMQ